MRPQDRQFLEGWGFGFFPSTNSTFIAIFSILAAYMTGLPCIPVRIAWSLFVAEVCLFHQNSEAKCVWFSMGGLLLPLPLVQKHYHGVCFVTLLFCGPSVLTTSKVKFFVIVFNSKVLV